MSGAGRIPVTAVVSDVSDEAAVADRRGVKVRLTRVGREAVDAALSDLLAHERELLGELTPEEQATLAGMLRRLNAPLEP